MSGSKTGTATLEQSEDLRKSIPNQIREIMGRKPPKGLFKSDTRAEEAKKLYKQLLALLAPYCKSPPDKVNTAVELGWSSAERDNFVNLTNQIASLAGTGSGKSYASAADKVNDAFAIAKANDRAKKMRADTQELLVECLEKIKPVSEYLRTKPNKDTVELLKGFNSRMATIREALKNFTGNPAQVLYDTQMLADDLDKAVADLPKGPSEQERAGTSPPVVSESVEKIRAELIGQLDAAMKSELAPTRKVVVDTLKNKELAKPEAAADNKVFQIYAEKFAIISNMSDRAKLPTWDTATDDQRIQNIRARGQEAMTGLAAACKDFRDTFATTGKDEFVSNGKQQERDANSQGIQAARKIFEANYKKIETALGQLADMGCPELKALTADCEDMKKLVIAADAYTGSDKLIELKLQRLEMAKSRTGGQAKGEVEKLTVALKQLQKELAQTYGRLDSAVQTAYHVLMDDAEQLAAVLKTGNIAAFKAAEVQMAKIREAGLGAGADALVQLVVDAKAVKTTATNKDIAKEYSSQANEILLAVKTCNDSLDMYDLPKTRKELDLVMTDGKNLVDTWLKLGKWREDIASRLGPVTENRKKLQALVKKVDSKKQDTTFDQDFRAVRDGYNKPGVDTAEIDKLLAGLENSLPPLMKELTDGLAKRSDTQEYKDAAARITKDQTDAKARTDKDKDEANAKKQAHEDVKKRRDAYLKLWNETEKKVKAVDNGDEDELKELKVLWEQVKDKIKAKDDEGATKQLDSIEPRLKLLFDHPGGVTEASMAKLGQINDNWQQALSATNLSIDQITASAVQVANDLTLTASDITKRSLELKRKIGAFNFRDSVLALSDDKTPIGRRKKAREDALKSVRALRNLLESDASMLKFDINPFAVKKPFATMRKFLNELEYNAMRAVPPE